MGENASISKNDFVKKLLVIKGNRAEFSVDDIEAALSHLSDKEVAKTKTIISNAYNAILTNDSRKRLMNEARDDLNTFLDTAKQELNNYRTEYTKLKEQYTQGSFAKPVTVSYTDCAGKLVKKPFENPSTKAVIAHPAFRGRLFPVEVSDIVEKTLGDKGNPLFKGASTVSGFMRTLQASMDFSAPFIQGLPVLARDPQAWAKATLEHFKAAADPSGYAKYLAEPDNMAIRAERLFFGGTGSISEFHEAVPQVTEILGEIPKIGGTLQTISKQTLGRTEMAYSAFGEVARDELWKALRYKVIDKTTGKFDTKLARELAATIDKMSGSLNINTLLIGKSQKEFENGFMFFASRYTRAGLALAADVFRGGLKGSEERKALGSLIAGGTISYIRVCNALGQQPNLDPTTGK